MSKWTPEHERLSQLRHDAAFSLMGVAKAIVRIPTGFSRDRILEELKRWVDAYETADAALRDLDKTT